MGEVEAAPLSDILTLDEVRKARIVKIDVEGDEWGVVKGMQPLLSEGRPDIEFVVEVSARRTTREGVTGQDVIDLFALTGFRPYKIRNDYSPRRLASWRYAKPVTFSTGALSRSDDLIFSRNDPD